MKEVLISVILLMTSVVYPGATSANYQTAENHGFESSQDFASYEEVLAPNADACAISTFDYSRSGIEVPETDYDTSNYVECEAVVTPIGDDVYRVSTPDGEILGTISIAPEENLKSTYAEWSIDWTLKAGERTAANSRFTSFDGFVIHFDLAFSRNGTTKIGYASHDKQAFYWVFTDTEGFAGRITFHDDTMGSVSFAIKNESANSINYNGSYGV